MRSAENTPFGLPEARTTFAFIFTTKIQNGTVYFHLGDDMDHKSPKRGLVKRASALPPQNGQNGPAAPLNSWPRNGSEALWGWSSAQARLQRRARARPRRRGRGPGCPRTGRHGAGRSKRRNARATAFWAHAARRQNAHSSTTREATPANPGRPGHPIAMVRSGDRGRPRVGSSIACSAFPRRTPHTAERRPPSPASKSAALRDQVIARRVRGGVRCMRPRGAFPVRNPELSG